MLSKRRPKMIFEFQLHNYWQIMLTF